MLQYACQHAYTCYNMHVNMHNYTCMSTVNLGGGGLTSGGNNVVGLMYQPRDQTNAWSRGYPCTFPKTFMTSYDDVDATAWPPTRLGLMLTWKY